MMVFQRMHFIIYDNIYLCKTEICGFLLLVGGKGRVLWVKR